LSAVLLFHVDDAGRWPNLLANLRNAQAAAPAQSLRVIANGQAPMSLWAKGHWRREIEERISAGVQVDFCENSLRNMGLNPDDRPAGSQLVAAGIIAIADAQEAGALYIKP
jgi:intracellular sulfur oxidation DsrE/DsrF family protein